MRDEPDGGVSAVVDVVQRSEAGGWPEVWKSSLFLSDFELSSDFLGSVGVDEELARNVGEMILAYLREMRAQGR